MEGVLGALRHMAGGRERCMYCLDSHGTDIEHFWPKSPYPERMFTWPNLLLCCAECGRFKNVQFPLADGQPLLVDPTRVDPWDHIDFDPRTGNCTARYQPDGGFSVMGEHTVEVLQLDAREALATGYCMTWKRLTRTVNGFLSSDAPSAADLPQVLLDLDDHGLLGWCFIGGGQQESPFHELRQLHPITWEECRRLVLGS